MAIEHIYRPHLLAKSKQEIIETPYTFTIFEGQHGYSDVITFHTPNVAQVLSIYGDKKETGGKYYERGDINVMQMGRYDGLLFQDSFERFIGCKDFFRWVPGTPQEDEKYAQLEKKILDHPFVGKTLAAYLGEMKKGICFDVAEGEGWRVELGQFEDEGYVVTTNALWTKVSVISGRRKGVYGQHDIPRLMVKVEEGPMKDNQILLTEPQLRKIAEEEDVKGKTVMLGTVDKTKVLSREKIIELIKEGTGKRMSSGDSTYWSYPNYSDGYFPIIIPF
ncbi:MAG: hypothetical protein PHQ59_04945 [Candidatus Daviesbacteria bacterium]|nr:hypothetical protein [Candidatus Daviesbacteria bacterium]